MKQKKVNINFQNYFNEIEDTFIICQLKQRPGVEKQLDDLEIIYSNFNSVKCDIRKLARQHYVSTTLAEEFIQDYFQEHRCENMESDILTHHLLDMMQEKERKKSSSRELQTKKMFENLFFTSSFDPHFISDQKQQDLLTLIKNEQIGGSQEDNKKKY